MRGRPLRRLRALYRAASASLAGRLVMGAAAIITVALVAAAVVLPQLYRDGLEDQLDAELGYLLDKLIARVSSDEDRKLVETEPMTERDYEQVYSGYYWQITSNGMVVLASRSLGGWNIAPTPARDVRQNVIEDITFTRPPDGPQRLRVVSRTIPAENLDTNLTYTVASRRSVLDENIEDFRVTIVLTILGLGLVLVGTFWLQVRFGLGPLRRIPKALATIRSGENDRLTGSFSSEVEPLVHEINALLDHNAEVVERARTHVGNLAHALKTPIAVLTNEAGGQKGPLADTVKAQIGIMKEQVDHHLSRARMAARAGVLGARTSVMPIVEGLARTLEKIYRERGITISVGGPPAIAFRGERQDLEEMLGNLLDNACKHAKSRVAVKAKEREGGHLRIEIGDDGPGIPAEQRRVAQKRGVRLDEKAPGSGLGLSIVNDIAEIYGGSFTLDASEWGGVLAILDLPLAGVAPVRKGR
jgi:signal transduction histidine kinase